MEVLSADEIDQLLAAISSGPDDDNSEKDYSPRRRIKIYDFKRPDVFSREQIRTITMVAELFAKVYTKELCKKSDKEYKIHVASVDQLTFEECVRAMPTPTCIDIGKVRIDDESYPIVVEVDPSISYSAMLSIPHMTANEEDEYKKMNGKRPLRRDLTDKEAHEWKPYIETIFSLLKKTFRTGFDSNVRSIKSAKSTISNPMFLDVIPPTDMTVNITLEAKATVGEEELEGLINVCLPAKLAQKLCDDYNGIVKPKSKQIDGSAFDEETKVPINVSLGTAQKTIKEIKGFGEGTIIELDKFAGEPVDITVNGKTIAKGEVVVIDENFGVRIVEIV